MEENEQITPAELLLPQIKNKSRGFDIAHEIDKIKMELEPTE